jgi:electron transport complex protein RnfD
MNNKFREKKLKNTRISVKPFVYSIPSISSVSIKFLILLGIQVLMLLLTKSFSAFFVVLTSLIGAVFASLVNYYAKKEPFYNIMSIAIQGIIIGLLLPQTYPLPMVFVISFATILISRLIVFKGINSWINIPALAIIIAWYIGNTFFPEFSLTAELLNIKNSSSYLIQNGFFPIFSFDTPITSWLNKNIFSLANVSIPEGYVSLLWDSQSIIPAFRFNLITIISSIIIFSDNSFSLIIPSIFLTVYAVLVRLFVPYLFGGSINQGDIILALLTSGILFCSVFLIQWYGTIPVTVLGKVLLGFLTGIIAFLIIGCGTSPVGMAYTIIISNIICMIIRIFEEKKNEFYTGRVIMKYSAKIAAENGDKK